MKTIRGGFDEVKRLNSISGSARNAHAKRIATPDDCPATPLPIWRDPVMPVAV
jgi:hypothetical protein